MRHRAAKAVTVAMLTLAASVGVPAANAATPNAATTNEVGMNQAEMSQLEQDVEVLFTRYIQLNDDNTFVVNEDNLIEDGEDAHIEELKALAAALNQPVTTVPDRGGQSAFQPNGNLIQPMGASEFAGCVALNALGIPALAASTALKDVIKDGIRAWNWKLTAKTIARIIGPQAAKALGGPVGIGVALGWAVIQCQHHL